MTITIDVSPEAAGPLAQKAAQSGLALPEYVQRIVEACAVSPLALPFGQDSGPLSAGYPVMFTTPEGEPVVLSSPLAEMTGRTALANEATISKIWDTPEEEAGCQALLAGM